MGHLARSRLSTPKAARQPRALVVRRARVASGAAGLTLAAIVLLLGCAHHAADRNKSNTRLDLAKDFLSKGAIEAAEQEAQKALGYDASNDEAMNLLGLLDLMHALGELRLVEIDDCLTGVDAEALRAEMDAHLRQADAHFAAAAELSADYGEARANRGVVAIALERYDDAARHLQEALAKPGRLNNIGLVRANLGWAHFHRGDYVGAATELRQAEQFQPGMCVANYRLGRVYFARKEWEKALEKFQYVTQQSDCPLQEAHLYLMRTMRQLARPDDLAVAAQRCAALAPRSCVAAQCRALAP